MATTTFAYTGAVQDFVVPAGITSVDIECWGAQGTSGGFHIGGKGGYAKATVTVTPAETLKVYVGGSAGFNGGGAGGTGGSAGGSGGGASDVRRGGTALGNRVIVAGGGGGGGGLSSNATGGQTFAGSDGGAGGGLTGSNGTGGGGTQTAGGGGNTADTTMDFDGTNGANGTSGTGGAGGNGGSDSPNATGGGGGGGGGGYYGGGGGEGGGVEIDGVTRDSYGGGGGGGGSSFTSGTAASTTPNVRTGNGQVKITYADNVAPSASTWQRTSGLAGDVNATLSLPYTFVDANAGDTQSKNAIKRDIGGTIRYYRDSDDTWQTTEQENTTASTTPILAAGWASASDPTAVFYVKTWDQAGLAGVYSSGLTVIPSAKVEPTLDEPDAGDTITTANVTAEWTVAEQTAYRLRVLSNAGVELWSSGWVADALARQAIVGYTLADDTSYQLGLTTKNNEGLESTEDVNAFSTNFTPPGVPTLSVAETIEGAFTITADNPASGSAFDHNDLWVRIASTSPVTDGNRTKDATGRRIAKNLVEDFVYTDYAVGSDVTYEYKVVAWGTNGTYAESAWTGTGVTYALGTATDTGAGTAPSGSWDAYTDARVYSVAVTGLPSISATVARKEPSGTEKGTVIIFSGGDGDDWWSVSTTGPEDFIDDELVANGYRVLQVKWSDGWFDTDDLDGPDVMAARPATLINHLHGLYCGSVDNLIITGHSGGASQCGYALARYGLSSIVSAVCFTAGPPHAAMPLTCAGTAPYYSLSGANKFDRAFGYAGDDTGPCAVNSTDEAWVARWRQSAIENGDLDWDDTRIYFQWGANDTTGATEQGLVLAEALRSQGRVVHTETIAGQGHGNNPSATGLIQLGFAIRGEMTHRQVKSANGTGTSLTVPFNSTPNAGASMVALVRATVPSAQVNTPSGWTRDLALDFDTSTKSLVVLRKLAEDGDTGVPLTFTASSITHVDLYEVLHAPDGLTLDVTSTVTASPSAGATVTIPTTSATAAAIEWAVAAAALDASSAITGWTDSFTGRTTSGRVQSATRTLRATETLGVQFTSGSGVDLGAAVVSYRKS